MARERGITRRLVLIGDWAPSFYPADIHPQALTPSTILWYCVGIMKQKRTSTADLEYSLGRPTSKVPSPNKRPRSASKHEKLYQLLLSLENEKWIPVKCPDFESARAMGNVARMYFYKREKKLELRYEDTDNGSTVYMRLVQ